jgi:hypothetical protein
MLLFYIFATPNAPVVEESQQAGRRGRARNGRER